MIAWAGVHTVRLVLIAEALALTIGAAIGFVLSVIREARLYHQERRRASCSAP